MIEYTDLVDALGEEDARTYADLHSELERGFMTPEYYHGACVMTDDGWMPDDGSADDPADCKEGWLCRLSASGYLDCTDWHGPYASHVEALIALVDLYAD